MNSHLKTLTDDNFDHETGSSDQLVLVDFTASWCGPCKQIAPLIDAIAEEYAGRVIVSKIDVDENPQLKVRFGVRGVPTLLLYRNGHEILRTDARTKTRLAAVLDAHLG